MKQKKKNLTNKFQNTLQTLKIKSSLKLYQLKLEGLVYGSTVLYAFIVGELFPSIVVLVSFNLIRPLTPTTFHFNNVSTCVKVSLCMFIISITQLKVLPMNVSLCFGIIIGLIICLSLYKIQYSLMKDTKINEMTKQDVIDICNSLNYNKDKQDLAIMFFVDKMSNKEIWETLCKTQRNVEWDTVNKYKYRIKKDFKNYIEIKE